MPDHEKAQRLAELSQELDNLTDSPLYEYRREKGYYAVLGEGHPDADVLFIGEAPGRREAEQGRPFVGASGKVLDELLESVGLARETVYITNVVKDRPPENRDPRREEIELYTPLLERQIAIIEPVVIATLGRFAMEFILAHFGLDEKGQKISRMHGRPLEAEASFGTVTILPLYHPAVALYNRNQRGTLEEDFEVLAELVR
jgi:DNA polymerase